MRGVGRFLFWDYPRGGWQYDVMVGLILAFIFLTPPLAFNDRPQFMRIPDQTIRQTSDDDGHTVYTVKVNTEQAAIDRLQTLLAKPVTVSRSEPVYDTMGALVAYSVWIER